MVMFIDGCTVLRGIWGFDTIGLLLHFSGLSDFHILGFART
jgi:PII-like signaling protein